MLGEKIACAIISPHLYVYCHTLCKCSVTCHSSTNGVLHAMEIAIAEGCPDLGLLTQQAFCFSPNMLARVNKVPIMTLAIASD